MEQFQLPTIYWEFCGLLSAERRPFMLPVGNRRIRFVPLSASQPTRLRKQALLSKANRRDVECVLSLVTIKSPKSRFGLATGRLDISICECQDSDPWPIAI